MNQARIAALKTRTFYLVVVGLGILGTVIGTKIASNGVTATELQSRLIVACEDSRAPLQDYFSGQLAESQSHGVRYYQERFPGFPPAELRRAIQKQRRNLSMLVETFDPDSCARQYR